MAEFRRNTGRGSDGSGERSFVRPERGDSGKSNRRDSGRRDSGRRDSGNSSEFNRRDFSRFGGRNSERTERTEVTCDSCKKRCEVPFKPTSNKPIYCSDCFRKDSGSKFNGGSRSNDSSKELMEINQKLDKIMKMLENN